MDKLRVSCPWDARQTHESLAPHLLEECYEALDALESGDPAALRDELGDVLLQVVFHARIAAEAADGTGYTIDDVAEGIVAKLIRRHPHVFADVTVSGPRARGRGRRGPGRRATGRPGCPRGGQGPAGRGRPPTGSSARRPGPTATASVPGSAPSAASAPARRRPAAALSWQSQMPGTRRARVTDFAAETGTTLT